MKMLVLNLKANYTLLEIENYINEIKNINNIENVIVSPSNIYLKDFVLNNLTCCAQDISKYQEGSYTGEVTASQIKSIGVDYTFLGHIERRKYFNENNDDISKKIDQAIKNDLKVILCINEINDLMVINKDNIKNIIIAYEPIESVGTNYVKDVKEIQKNIEKIKEELYNQYGYGMKVLYGGSVNDKTIENLKKLDCIDGFIISSSALDINKFIKIKEVIWDE